MARIETWNKSAGALLAQVETLRVRLKYLGNLATALVLMIGLVNTEHSCWILPLLFKFPDIAQVDADNEANPKYEKNQTNETDEKSRVAAPPLTAIPAERSNDDCKQRYKTKYMGMVDTRQQAEDITATVPANSCGRLTRSLSARVFRPIGVPPKGTLNAVLNVLKVSECVSERG